MIRSIKLEGPRWRQKVTGPFGDERYVCEGEWILNQLNCQSPKAAKPRRDLARPYAYLDRGNTLQINAKRWVHSQVNRKIAEDGSLYAVEAGWNLYQRVDEKRCGPAPKIQ